MLFGMTEIKLYTQVVFHRNIKKMHRYIIGIVAPPLAICRYGCASCCAFPITVYWLGGLAALAYHFFKAPIENSWLYNGSLILGLVMISLSVIWTELTIKRVIRDGCDEPAEQKRTVCDVLPGGQESDPFEEVRKAKEL